MTFTRPNNNAIKPLTSIFNGNVHNFPQNKFIVRFLPSDPAIMGHESNIDQ